jgi:hypothetical protein
MPRLLSQWQMSGPSHATLRSEWRRSETPGQLSETIDDSLQFVQRARVGRMRTHDFVEHENNPAATCVVQRPA